MKTTKRTRIPRQQAGHAARSTRIERSQAAVPLRAHSASLSEGLNQATRKKILTGAMLAVSRQGTKKLAMGDICNAAGVSRGTLYRYFATKDDVLHAMGDFVSTTFEEGVVEVARRHADPVDILRAVLEFHFSQTRQSARVLEIEPLYVMGFLRDHFARHIAALKTALAPVFAYIEREAGMPVDEDLIAQVLIRMELSTLLVPADPLWNQMPEVLPAMLQSMVDTTRGTRARPAAAAIRPRTSWTPIPKDKA